MYYYGMADNDNFSRLAAELTLKERQALLEKLLGQSNISHDPLYSPEPITEKFADFGEQYLSLPWYSRLWYFILGLFRGRTPMTIYEERQLSLWGQEIEAQSPGLFDSQRGKLLPVFYFQLMNLKTAARFFYTALEAGFGRDKGSFYAFLGSLEMPQIHSLLQTNTDPAYLEEKNPGIPDQELRQTAFRNMDDVLLGVTDESRNAMYTDARSLNCLMGLSSFLFDRIIMSFSLDTALNGHTCSVGLVREMLLSLNDILFSLKTIPSMTLLESLFVFLLQEKAGEPGFEIDKEMRLLLTKAEEALAVIREFNMRVPLTKILRCTGRKISVPHEISGGEDWFVVYRDFWKRQIDNNFTEYVRQRRRRELLSSFRYFLNGTNLRMMANTATDTNPDGFPLKGALGLSFLLSFYSVVFMEDINKTLRSIMIDGEFSKKENRTEFNESYNGLIKIEDLIHQFESKIAPSGDYGKRYALARQTMSSLPIKRRKIQIVADEASAEALAMTDDARRSCRSMINILGGILGRDNRGRYFSLSNLSRMTDKSGEFIKIITDAISKFMRVLEILDDIDALESGR